MIGIRRSNASESPSFHRCSKTPICDWSAGIVSRGRSRADATIIRPALARLNGGDASVPTRVEGAARRCPCAAPQWLRSAADLGIPGREHPEGIVAPEPDMEFVVVGVTMCLGSELLVERNTEECRRRSGMRRIPGGAIDHVFDTDQSAFSVCVGLVHQYLRSKRIDDDVRARGRADSGNEPR